MHACADVKGPLYRFNPETTPKEVFERFFGTRNPYEALEGVREGLRQAVCCS